MTDFDLSPSGRARREQILKMAVEQGQRQRRQRLAVRGGAVAIVLLAIVATVLRMPHSNSRPIERPFVKSPLPPAPAPQRTLTPKIAIERIQTDPTIAQRLAVAKTPPRWQRLDDDHLIQELAQAGKPAGLVKINGQAAIVFQRPAR